MILPQRTKRTLNFLKTTAIGGIFFLLPLIIIGTFLAKFAQFSIATAKAIDGYIPLAAIGGYAMLLVVGIAAIVGLCFAAGLLAKRSIAQRFTESIEKQLQIAFPRYAIVKDRISGNIGGGHFKSELKSLLVRGHDGFYRLGIEVERNETGWVTVYFPGSPDPWSGSVAIVPQESLSPVTVDFLTAMTTLEKLGRELQTVTQCQTLLRR
jgi:uncharacterized membrane protein